MRTRFCALAISVGLLLLIPGVAGATPFQLTDQNSTVFLETGAGGGVQAWVVDDVNHLAFQWFFISIGGSGFVPLDALGVAGGGTSEIAMDTNPFVDDNLDTLAVRYGNDSPIVVDLTLTLRGGLAGSGVSDLAETLVLSNLGEGAQEISFIQYVDFNLNANPDDIAQILNDNTVRQADSKGQTTVAEEVVTPAPNVAAVGDAGVLLQDILSGGFAPATGPVGPGDVAWAFQWDIRLDGGQTFLISKDKRLGQDGQGEVPEPSAAALALIGSLGLALIGRRRGARA